MEEVFNKYKMFTFWVLFAAMVLSLYLYLDYKRDVSGISTSNGKITVDEKIQEQLEQDGTDRIKELRSSNFVCPANIPTNDNFSPDDTLYFPLQLVNILPDSNYIMQYDKDSLLLNLNNAYKDTKLQFMYTDFSLDEVYPDVTKKVLRQQDLLNLYNRYDVITLIIIPGYTILDIELNASQKKKTKHVYGRANGIGSTTCFMREESALGGITSHEFGHMFGLRHLHEGNLVVTTDGYSCDLGDKVFDTPATGTGVYVVSPEGNCRYESDDPSATSEETRIIYSNYMAYTNPLCMGVDTVGFTNGQISAMRAFIDESVVHREMIINNDFMFSFELVNKLFID